MAKQESENFTVRLTKQDRHYLDLLANECGISAGRFLTGLLRREIIKTAAEIAKTAVTRIHAVKYGVPEKIADTLNDPKDLEGIMEAGKYRQFFDECWAGIMSETKEIKAKFEAQEYAEK